MSKQDKYTKSSRGQECQIRFKECCCDPETTIFAHLNGSGLATKSLSIHGSYACNICHDIVDGRRKSVYSLDYIKLSHLEGVVRTQVIMVANGILKL
jgi:hypothetical protein